jgi:hypothetical protein
MTRKLLLIVTEATKNGAEFFTQPYGLQPEQARITGPASLNYIGLSNFAAVILDCPSLIKDLRKISHGIRDDSATEALWSLFSGEYNIPLFILVNKKASPSIDMRNLGISYILPKEIKDLALELGVKCGTAQSPIGPASEMLTADDVKEMAQKGIRTLEPGMRLTGWAEETAKTLGMSLKESKTHFLLDLTNLSSRSSFEQIKSDIFDISTALRDAFFVVNPLHMPFFAELFPGLRHRMVSPTIHWAAKGAFTGEISAAMLADLKCYGAIVPARLPYCEKKQLDSLFAQAQKYDLQLFSTFTLANKQACDIIATESNTGKPMIPVYSQQPGISLTESSALIADLSFFKKKLINGKEFFING